MGYGIPMVCDNQLEMHVHQIDKCPVELVLAIQVIPYSFVIRCILLIQAHLTYKWQVSCFSLPNKYKAKFFN